ncbi:MAG: DUF885 family protein, partial [Woeseiaceae bacterium]|nr:DUF885 family protein [Woeseiaceae bacterium]
MNRCTQRALPLLLVLLLPSLAMARSAADEAFENLAHEYLSDLVNFSPVSATYVGDHSADHRLDQVDAAARERNRQLYKEYEAALAAIERSELSRANQIDAALLDHEIQHRLWALTSLQEWAWNPRVYSDLAGSSVYSLMSRDFAPIEQRLMSAAARLEQLPRLYAQARESLQPGRVPKIHAETTISQNPGLN